MQYLVMDFETRSTVSLKTSSYRCYATHPTTDILCIGFKQNGRPARVHTPISGPVLKGKSRPIELMHAIEHKIPIVVHNAAFERRIYYWICHKRFGWPPIPDEQFIDTMSLCAYYALPMGLAAAAIALNLDVQKDKDAGRELDEEGKSRHVLTQVTKPRTPSKKAVAAWMDAGNERHLMPLSWWEDEIRLNSLYGYCRDDAVVQEALFLKLGPLPPERRAEWLMDTRVNDRGLPVDWPALYSAENISEQSLQSYNTRLKTITRLPAYPEGMVRTVNERAKILDWCELKGVRFTSLAKASVEEMLELPGLPADVREVLTIRQDAGKSSLGKLGTMLSLSDDDERIRDTMVWHGASTGRKTGRGMQPHNLPRDCMADKEAGEFHKILLSDNPFRDLSQRYSPTGQSLPDVISSAIRSFIKAPRGKKFLISDLSNIETRNLAWLSGCKLLMEAFSTGSCPYRQFASRIYNVRADSVEKGSQERQMGKVAVLGLGYQMGGPKFQVTAAAPPYHIELDTDRAKEIVNLYRTTYPEVPQMWRNCESAMMEAIQSKSQVTCGRVVFGCNGEWGWIVLPSGRPIWFYEPKVTRIDDPWREGKTKLQISYMGKDIRTKQWVRRHTYGGSIVESISQGMAGCLLQAIITRCEYAGLPVILTVHDEVVVEANERESLDRFHEIVKTRPAWCPDLPIECESHEAVRYGK
jgi:DNA polymerase bacteriophage-type